MDPSAEDFAESKSCLMRLSKATFVQFVRVRCAIGTVAMKEFLWNELFYEDKTKKGKGKVFEQNTGNRTATNKPEHVTDVQCNALTSRIRFEQLQRKVK